MKNLEILNVGGESYRLPSYSAGDNISIDEDYKINASTDPSVTSELESINNKIKDIELFKFPNTTIVGEPTINNGQISNLSTTAYLKFPFLVDFKNRPFEIQMEFTTGSNVTSQQNIFDSDFGLAFAIRNNAFVIAVSSNGVNWNIGEGVGTHAISANTTYKVKLGWDGSVYTLSYSTDGGESWVIDITKTSSEAPYPKQIYIGVGESNSIILNVFSGIINLNYANLYVSGELVWQGMDDVGLASRLATDLSNIDPSGEDKVKDIAGNIYKAGANISISDDKTISADVQEIVGYEEEEGVLVIEGQSIGGTAGTIKPYMYDEKETLVGVYKGKPLYRKVYTYGEFSTSSSIELPLNINGFEKSVNMSGAYNFTNDGISREVPENWYGHTEYFTSTQIVGNKLACEGKWGSLAKWDGVRIALEYTKTTDAPGSGDDLMPYGYIGKGGNECYHKYSTEEHIIGQWIDGSDIYERTFVVNDISVQNAEYDIDSTLCNNIIDVSGSCKTRINSGVTYNLCYPPNTDGSIGVVRIKNGHLQIVFWSDNLTTTLTGFELTIRYIKED